MTRLDLILALSASCAGAPTGHVAWALRSARRGRAEPELRDDAIGFRVVRRPRRQHAVY